MALWYMNARVCVAHLGDVSSQKTQANNRGDQLGNSTWFTRGWTLQELPFSSYILFYDREWLDAPGFNKRTNTGTLALSLICKVTVHCLLSCAIVHKESVADRMSWAAQRQY